MPEIKKTEILFLINPNAGKQKIHTIINQLTASENDIRYVITGSIEELDRVMREELSKYTVFVAVGGDGTASAVSKHLVQTDKMLAVLPAGSGNGFANELGFTSDLKSLIHHIVRGEVLEIDVLTLNREKFINIAGIGFDGEVVHHLHRYSKSGLMNYIVSSLQTFGTYKPVEIHISDSGINIHGDYFMVTIANTRQYGNMAILSPHSKPDDGQFEIVCVKPLSFLRALMYGMKMFNGKIKPSKHLQFFASHQPVVIRTNTNNVHLDGEAHSGNGTYEIGILKKSLKVIRTGESVRG